MTGPFKSSGEPQRPAGMRSRIDNVVFASRISGHIDAALVRQHRGDVNNFSAASLEHVPTRELAEEEHCVQV
jgi:hypothetical protein